MPNFHRSDAAFGPFPGPDLIHAHQFAWSRCSMLRFAGHGHCGAHPESRLPKTSCAAPVSPMRSAGGLPAACIFSLSVEIYVSSGN